MTSLKDRLQMLSERGEPVGSGGFRERVMLSSRVAATPLLDHMGSIWARRFDLGGVVSPVRCTRRDRSHRCARSRRRCVAEQSCWRRNPTCSRPTRRGLESGRCRGDGPGCWALRSSTDRFRADRGGLRPRRGLPTGRCDLCLRRRTHLDTPRRERACPDNWDGAHVRHYRGRARPGRRWDELRRRPRSPARQGLIRPCGHRRMERSGPGPRMNPTFSAHSARWQTSSPPNTESWPRAGLPDRMPTMCPGTVPRCGRRQMESNGLEFGRATSRTVMRSSAPWPLAPRESSWQSVRGRMSLDQPVAAVWTSTDAHVWDASTRTPPPSAAGLSQHLHAGGRRLGFIRLHSGRRSGRHPGCHLALTRRALLDPHRHR